MGSSIRDTVETLIRKLKADVTPNTVLVPLNEYYEIKQVPSLLVIGPKMEENRAKRISEKIVEIDRDTEIGRHIAKLFVSYIAKEFGNGCYAVERVAEPEDPVGDGVTPSTETRCGAS